ncbi:MAG: integration host factor subunit beta [Acidobacteria bacterium]|nr:integration host factor subunit beta [Acidobacteriota bacterium]MCZ6769508.1 integration host factor subunit beta [Acidobacteriota bacterium]MCZ6877722.1 integration host factor subunit beta [Acidobacteriota bacterium]
MTKADLTESVAKSSQLTQREAGFIVQIVLDSVVDALKSGDKVELRGFGSFRLRERKPRQARNPKTGETFQVPAKTVAYFTPGRGLKEFINS